MRKSQSQPQIVSPPSERARRVSGVLEKEHAPFGQDHIPFDQDVAEDAFAHDDFTGDDPTDPHAFDPSEYAKLSKGEGTYRWHDEDTDLRRALARTGARRRLAARETARLAMPEPDRHFPLPVTSTQPQLAANDALSTANHSLTPAQHSELDTQPKIPLPGNPLPHPLAAHPPAPSIGPPWKALTVGFVAGVATTLAIAWLLQLLS